MFFIWFDKGAIQQAESKSKAKERIDKLNTLIDTLIAAQIEFAADPNKREYGLDDGQTKIKMIYRDLDAVSLAIIGYERLISLYVNRINGRVSRSMDSKNFPNWRTNYIP